jgi:hypothetical protein
VPPEFAPVTDDPKLPRVLIIGDSVSVAYTLAVRKDLTGIANVHAREVILKDNVFQNVTTPYELKLGDTTKVIEH